jgi:hypothetical protein
MIRLQRCAVALLVSGLAAACSSSPKLSITSPADLAQLGPSADLDAASPGVQIAVDALTDAADGSWAAAVGGGPRSLAQVKSGRLHFDAVTLGEGPVTLSVSVVDKNTDRWTATSIRVLADSMATGCRFTSPADHSVVIADPGDTGFVVQEVDVFCRGLDAGTVVGLTLGASDGPVYSKALSADGTARFNVQLLSGDNLIGLIAKGAPLKLLTLTVSPPEGSVRRCSGDLALPSGTLFNLTGAGGAVADLDPGKAGIQARLVVTNVPVRCDQEPARLVLSQGANTATYTAKVDGGQAAFDVDLFEGANHVEAFVGHAGTNSAALRPADYTADGVPVTVGLTSPVAGAVLGDADNVSNQVNVFQAAFSGTVTGASALYAGSESWLSIDEGTAQAALVSLLDRTSPQGAFTGVAQTLSSGPHTARVWARRKSGNAATTGTIAFAVAYNNGSLAIASPADQSLLGHGAHVLAQPGGALVDFRLTSKNLAGAQATVTCTANQQPVSATGTIAAVGDTTLQLFLPLTACGPTSYSCAAQARPAQGSVVFSNLAAIAVDVADPSVSLTAPLSGSTRSGTFDLHATTGCPGETQTAQITVGGVARPAFTVTGNAIDVSGIALTPGQNPIVLTVTDAAGNSGIATAALTYLQGAPDVQITAPKDGATLVTEDDVRPDLADGLQANVLVQVDNRPVGTAVDLLLGSSAGTRFKQTAVTVLDQGQVHRVATFPAVSLREGLSTLSATVTDVVIDPVQPAPVTATANVTVNTGRPACDVVLPSDHTVWSPAEDSRSDVAGFQHAVQVLTTAGGSVKLNLTPISGGGTAYSQSKVLSGGGLQTVTFDDVTFTDGAWSVDAICVPTTGSQGRALPNLVTLNLTGPVVSITKPAVGAAFTKADFNGAGTATLTLGITGGDGGTASVVIDCGNGPATYPQAGPATIPAGGVLGFDVALVPDGAEALCSVGVTAKTAAGVAGLPLQVKILADRSTPAPALVTPLTGTTFGPTAPELDCSNQNAPLFKQVQVSVTDPVPASGLQLTITGPSGTPSIWAGTPTTTPAGGTTWTWPNVAVANGTSVLSVKATDAAGNVGGPAQATVTVRCVPTGVNINLLAGSSKLGYAQDKDHSAIGEQVTVVVNATAANGSAIRVCSTLGTASGSCTTSGYKPILTSPAAPTIQGGTATFDVTVPEGAQQLIAEVDANPTDASGPRAVTAHYLPPHVTGLTLLEDTTNDGALNQAELTAAGSTVNFKVDVGILSFISGNKVELFSTASSVALGSVVAPANGPTSVTVPVPLSALLAGGGYQRYVFYARVLDEAGNFNSTPGNVYPITGETVVTVGTAASPFVVAPNPTISLTRPTSGVTSLTAADDSRCSPGPCPGVSPLRYPLSATTNAPDGSTVTFLLDGGNVAQASTSGGAVSNVLADLANGKTRVLSVQVADAWGNVASAPGQTLLIDSVPPQLTLSNPADGSSINAYPYAGTVTVSAGGPLEAGQQVSVFSDLEVAPGLVGSVTSDGSSSLQVNLRLSKQGTHKLYAQATDAAGNTGRSPQISVTQNFSGASVGITAPASVAGTAWFGTSTQAGGRCQPVLQTTTNNAPDGTPVTLWVNATSDCSGSPGSGAVSANVTSNVTTFTGLLTFANHDTGYLCAQVTVASTAHSGAQQFACDLDTPTVAFATPAANTLFVANGQSISGATQNQQNNTTTLFADLSVTFTAVDSSVVKVFADGGATPITTAAVTAGTNATKSFAAVGIPIPAGAASTTHTLTATVTAPSGNSSTVASRTILADIFPPAEAAPVFTVTNPVTGVVRVSIASVPKDDGVSGSAAPTWDVRYRQGPTALDANNWSTAFTATVNLAGNVPGSTGTTSFDLLLPSDQSNLWVGVRAVDRVGNLGAFTAMTVPNVSTAVTRGPAVAVPNADAALSPVMRVADLDGDGFDDVIIAYPNDNGSDGRVYIFFGSATGLKSAPMTLAGLLPSGSFGLLGAGSAFDVGDFDGDGKVDVVAAETDCATANVLVWKGSAIATAKANSTTPAPLKLQSGALLVGGTVRAVGKTTAGVSAAGDDLLVYNWTPGCQNFGGTPPANYTATLLPRGGTWLTSGNTALLTSAGAVTVGLPAGQPGGGFDAAAFNKHGSTSRDSLAISFVEVINDTNGNKIGGSHELRAFSGDVLAAGASIAWTSGALASYPGDVAAADSYAQVIAGGRDAVGSVTTDLAVSDIDHNRVLVYDGDSLLTVGAIPLPAATLSPTGAGETGGGVGSCAVLLPDLDGDGKAEYAGCSNDAGAQQTSPVYFAFGFSGSAPPWSTSYFPPWTFLPSRGQKIGGPTTSAVWGQAVGAGHLSSATRDLVVLSHSTTGSDTLRLVH